MEKITKKQKRKKLFLSFGHLLYQLKNKEVNQKDLNEALFYFGCEKAYLLADTTANDDVKFVFNLEKNNEKDLESAVRAYSTIRVALFNAIDEGRADFRKKDGNNSYAELNQLLEKNNIDISPVKHLETTIYDLPTVRDNYSNIIDVIWH